jgi:hypothetical protein
VECALVREPVFQILLPQKRFRLRPGHRSAYPDPVRLVYVQDAYTNEDAQANIVQGVDEIVERAGIDFIGLEGAHGDKAFHLFRAPLAVWSKYRPLSVGVDNEDLTRIGVAALQHLKSVQDVREKVFSWIRDRLRETQQGRYSADIAAAQNERTGLFPDEKLSALAWTQTLVRISDARGLDLSNFPTLSSFAEVTSSERQIDFQATEVERNKFVEALIGRVMRRPDPTGLAENPLFNYWLTSIRMTDDERRTLLTQPFQYILYRFSTWLQHALIGEAVEMRVLGDRKSSSRYYRRLYEVADALEWNWRQVFPQLAKYGPYLERAAGMRSDVMVLDLLNATDYLLDAGNEEERRLARVERKLGALYRALRLEMYSFDAEVTEVTPGCLTNAVAELGWRVPLFLGSNLGAIDDALSQASEFLDSSRRRSVEMGRNTVETMFRLKRRRGILIAGGFHERGIMRQLEDRRSVSWSILTPEMSGESHKRAGRMLGR